MTERIPQRDALRLLLAALVGGEPAGGLVEVRWRRPGSRWGQLWHDCRHTDAVIDSVLEIGATRDCFIGCAPRRSEHGGRAAVERVWALWADLDGPSAARALATFEPAPALVVRSGTGSNCHAYWPLRVPLSPDEAKSALRRLAQHLGADMAAAEPARILRPPGTRNFKTDPPASVECARLEVPTRALSAEEIVGQLPDPGGTPAPSGPSSAARVAVAAGDPLHRIPPPVYVEALTGRPVGRDGKCQCPFHAGGQERTPSLHAYASPEAGWWCYSCDRGGSIIDFGAALYGVEPRGRGFHDLRRRLAADLLGAVEAA